MSRQAKPTLAYVAKGSRLVLGSRTRVAAATGTMSADAVPPVICGRCWREMVLHRRRGRPFHSCQRCRRRIDANNLALGVLIGIYQRRRGRSDVDLEQLANALGIEPVEVGEQVSWIGVNQDTLSLHWTQHGGMSKTTVVGADSGTEG